MQIRYSGYVNCTGYGTSFVDYLSAMHKVNPDRSIRISAVNGFKKQNGISDKKYQWLTQLKTTKLEPEYISIQHCIPRIYIKDAGKKRIGIAIFETLDPPIYWVQKMNEMDHIITASEFNKGVFQSAGVNKPISVVPHCFNTELFNSNVMPKGRYNLFTFLYISSYRQRKNFDGLINAFYEAFSTRDKVCLLLKTDNAAGLQKLINSIKRDNYRTKETAPVYIDNKIIDFEDIPSFMRKADVYISPSLGEGFGYGGLHSMSLGIPLITTKYSGCLEYAKPELCTYIVPFGFKRRLQMDGLPQFKAKIWPEIKISEIRDKMLYAYNSYDKLKEISRRAYNYVHLHFNYNVIGRRFLSVVEELESEN